MRVKNISIVRFFTYFGVSSLTVFFIFLCYYTDLFSFFNATKRGYIITFFSSGVFLFFAGAYLSIITGKQYMGSKEVVQTRHSSRGVYNSVRNPIYSAIFLLTSGFLLMTYNFLALVIIGVNWIIFTLVIIYLEEPRLLDKLDDEYLEYTIQTNRLIPWFGQYFETKEFNQRDKIFLDNAEEFLGKEIEAPLMGTYFQTIVKIFWFRKGICFITDEEIGFYSYDVFRGHYTQLVRFERISSFVYGKSNFGYSIQILASNTSINLYFIQKGNFEKFVKLTKDRLDF